MYDDGVAVEYPYMTFQQLHTLTKLRFSLFDLEVFLERFLCPLDDELAERLNTKEGYFIPSPHLIKELTNWPCFQVAFRRMNCLVGYLILDKRAYPVLSCVAWVKSEK